MKITDVLSKDEIRDLTQTSDVRAFASFFFNWGFIAAIFAMAIIWTNPLTIFVALVLLGGRQLGLGVMMHDCGHRSFFKTPWINDFVGQWFCAAPTVSNLKAYRASHAQHHRLAGTKDDPDLNNYKAYAVSRSSLARKIFRDLTGLTGLKIFCLVATRGGVRVMAPVVIANAAMFGVLYLLGHGWAYLLWPAAYFTTHMLIIRLRQAAEHAVVPDLFDLDPRKNTRTTLPYWWERLLFAPNQVNYHLEHHLLATVPPYHLRRMHELLDERGFYGEAEIIRGYWNVFRKLTVA